VSFLPRPAEVAQPDPLKREARESTRLKMATSDTGLTVPLTETGPVAGSNPALGTTGKPHGPVSTTVLCR